jgi:uncharacterized protein
VEEFAELTEAQHRLEAMLDGLGDEGMLLGELDGFLCGVISGPEVIPQDEWLPLIHGSENFEIPADVEAELISLVLARHDEIVGELSAGTYQPLYEIDPTDDGVMWEVWTAGFEVAMGLRLAAWESLLKSHKESRAQDAALAIVSLLAASDPDAPAQQDPEILQLQRNAPNLIPDVVTTLYRAHRLAVQQKPVRSAAVGRNDPCPCGSGLKYKRCHGAA